MTPRVLRSTRDGLLGLAYPAECRVCSGSVESWDDGVACAECWDNPTITKLFVGDLCAKCGAQLSGGPATAQHRVCGMCGALPFTAARACGSYSGALEASILFLKVNPHISPRLRALIKRAFAEHREAIESEIVIPVPLHKLRERRRGFNQAAIIAELLAREFNLGYDDRSLVRTRATDPHRAGMDAADRARSVERAFEVVRPRLIAGGSVLLVDDVFTTGSTISAATLALIEAGARQVSVLTVARVTNV
ncbi:MAG TPA: ComF family protein [Blastocatellia bacterium]|nr:ComF family protein [Blastocatellia bacterium]